MPNDHSPSHPTPIIEAHRNSSFFSPEEEDILKRCLQSGQEHLFAKWGAPGIGDEGKRALLNDLARADAAYPGGIPSYVENARRLLRDAVLDKNPFEGCTPESPDIIDLTSFGPDYDAMESLGLAEFAHTAVVLVAGGLGERLGYHGIKLDIPVEILTGTTYLAHYASVLQAAGERLGRAIPLVIMTSRDTDAGTRGALERHSFFGLDPSQVTILRQELVPALSDVEGHLAQEEDGRLLLKPHGHGDIHMLLHQSGTAARLAASGIRHLLFIQDTNAQVFNAAFAALGVSVSRGYDFNSIAVNRIPGEAAGGIARLVRDGLPDLTINVEYNLLDPLLRATVSPEGDVPDARGFSRFPGNINLLIIRLAPYLHVLEESRGVVAEFVNPKFADSTRTAFKKPARLETLMQDLPKNFTRGEKVGVTVFDRAWCFSACKNNLADAAAKAATGSPAESASSAENDFYAAGRIKLRQAGMTVQDGPVRTIAGIPVVDGPRVVLRPRFALTVADVRAKVQGGSISGRAALVLDGDAKLDSVHIADGQALFLNDASAKPQSLLQNSAPVLVELTAPEITAPSTPEFLRIRGYRLAPHNEARAGENPCDGA